MSLTDKVFMDVNLNNVRCPFNGPCQNFCRIPQCENCPAMCNVLSCECQKLHPTCERIGLCNLMKNISAKKISTEQIQLDLQSIFEQAIAYIFNTRKQILNNLRFLGLSRNQIEFVQSLKKQEYYLMNSYQINQLSQKMETSQFQRIEKDLAKVLYAWHLQERYKFSFQKLKNVFLPYEDLFNETESILLDSEQETCFQQGNQSQKLSKMMVQNQKKCIQKSQEVDEFTHFLRAGYRIVPKHHNKSCVFRRSQGS